METQPANLVRSANAAESLRNHYEQLHALVLATIVSLLVMGVGVNLFIFKQMRAARTQLAASRALVQNLTEQYQLKEPAMRRFVSALQSFTYTNPDFQPILARYRPALPQFFTEAALNSANRPAPSASTPSNTQTAPK